MPLLFRKAEVFRWKKCLTVKKIFFEMSKLKITQTKSGINRTERQKRTLKALGLTPQHSVEAEATPQILGMITKVKHLVSVEEI